MNALMISYCGLLYGLTPIMPMVNKEVHAALRVWTAAYRDPCEYRNVGYTLIRTIKTADGQQKAKVESCYSDVGVCGVG